jgi:nucleoside-diphosphate kinase
VCLPKSHAAAGGARARPRSHQLDRTLILIKPDAFARGLTGEIIARFERKGLEIAALRLMTIERELAERHYAEHAEKPFFVELVEFITSGRLVAMVLEGEQAVAAARQVIGATNPLEAAPGSIRGDFAIETGTNLVHGSDSDESAGREIELFFPNGV